MSDLATELAKFTSILERFFPVFEQFVVAQHSQLAQKTSGPEDTSQPKPTQKKQGQKTASGLFASAFSAATSVVSGAMSQGMSTDAYRVGVADPAQRAVTEVKQLSAQGIVLGDDEADRLAEITAQQQLAGKINMKKMRARVDAGLMKNIENFAGEIYTDIEEKATNGGPFGAFQVAREMPSELWAWAGKKISNSFGLDAFGR